MNDPLDKRIDDRRDNRMASLWLVSDMCLNITALSLVKGFGGQYPAWQVVFLRAFIGLLILAPWLYIRRHNLPRIEQLSWQIIRALLSAITLTASFYAIATLPLSFFMTMNFTRPLLLMVMCAFFLKETITRLGWMAGFIGLIGVVIAIDPFSHSASSGLLPTDPTAASQSLPAGGLFAMLLTVLAGTSAILVTRKLKGTSLLILMLFYSGGLTLFTAVPALTQWVSIESEHWPGLIAIGAFTQCAQFCFIHAHKLGDANILAPLGYLSLLIATVIGFLFFAEIPSLQTVAGAILIVVATLLVRQFSGAK